MIEFVRPRFVRQCYGCPEEASWPLPPAQPCCPAPTVEAPQQGVQGPGQSGGKSGRLGKRQRLPPGPRKDTSPGWSQGQSKVCVANPCKVVTDIHVFY